jgi:autotransporter-associated beta strand protein
MVPGGTVTLHGANTYTGPTTVFPGTLIVKKAAGLYHGDSAKWTPVNITVHKAATLRLSVGGPGEFTGTQISALLANLTTRVNDNGLMGGSVLSLDTAKVTEPVTVAANIADSMGPGGGAFLFKKCGAGALRLAGKNTYTGQTILESGTLSVSSFNSFTKGLRKPVSSLGVPLDIEAGEIVMGDDGKDGECALIYSGTGETTDRVMNLAGKNSTVTFDQAGTGLLKLTSSFVISGYGANKQIVLTGDTTGTGELAGTLANPHDRAGKATTSLTKSGEGTWTLSGANTYSGPTKVINGKLSLTSARSLGDKTEIEISEGATLDLNFKGQMKVGKLSIGGKAQAAGTHGATGLPKALKGTGVLVVGL